MARRPVIQIRCSRLGRGVLSRRGLCFLAISRQLTPAEVSGRAVWAGEGGVKAKHGPPGLSFAPPTRPVVSAVSVVVFPVICASVSLRCSEFRGFQFDVSRCPNAFVVPALSGLPGVCWGSSESGGGRCKSIEQGRVVHRYAFQAVLGSRVDSASEFQFRTLESCQI